MPRRRIAVVVPENPLELKAFLTTKLNEMDDQMRTLMEPVVTGTNKVLTTTTTPQLLFGIASPLNVVSAPVGSLYLNVSGGAATTLFVKESGTGSAGWVGK